ncbi:MAG: hypothetical protein LBT11_07405 [Treponema sp.]|nr:hypothetical protein [Treponema sp.]
MILMMLPVLGLAAEPGAFSALIPRLDAWGLSYEPISGEGTALLVSPTGRPAGRPAGRLADTAPRLVLMIPFPSATEGDAFSFGAGAALDLLREGAPLLAVFLADPSEGSVEAVLGDILARRPFPEDDTWLYLDLPDPPARFRIHHGSRGRLSPLDRLGELTQVLEDRKLPYYFALRAGELYAAGAVEGPAFLESALGAGLSALVLESAPLRNEWGRSAGTSPLGLDALTGVLSAFANAAGTTSPVTPDTHYLVSRFGDTFRSLGELALCLIVLVICATLAALSILRGVPRELLARIALTAATLTLPAALIIDLNAAPAALWVLACTIPGAYFRRPVPVLICAALVPAYWFNLLFTLLAYSSQTGLAVHWSAFIPLSALMVLLPAGLLMARGFSSFLSRRQVNQHFPREEIAGHLHKIVDK